MGNISIFILTIVLTMCIFAQDKTVAIEMPTEIIKMGVYEVEVMVMGNGPLTFVLEAGRKYVEDMDTKNSDHFIHRDEPQLVLDAFQILIKKIDRD